MASLDIETGVTVYAMGTAAVRGSMMVRGGSMMVREGCSGSPRCALEIYAAEGINPIDGPNFHFDGVELEQIYQAIKAVRKARRGKS
jgi:hypothetical protein